MNFSLDFGSALGGLVGLLGANAGSRQQYKYQSRLQEQAAQLNYAYGLKSAENMPSSTRKGLETAGYNPMLAVQNGTSGANASFTSTGQAQNVDYAGALSSGLSNVLSVQQTKNQTKQTEASADEAYANADKAKAEKATLLERMPWISQREKAEIGNIEKDSMKKEAEIHNLEETTRYIEKNYELQKRLGEMGIDVQRYGIDKNFAGTVYNADTNERINRLTNEVNERNNKRTNRVNTSLEHIRHPYSSYLHKSYTSGKDYKGSYRDPWSQ